MLEELVMEEEFKKLAGKGRVHYFLYIEPVTGMLEGKRVDLFSRRIRLDVTAQSPAGHILKFEISFGKYAVQHNKQGVLVLDDEGQDAMKEAHAWQQKHFPKATRGMWKVAKNA